MVNRWPTGAQYSAAIQQPQSCFATNWLRDAEFAGGLLGLPAAASGQTAMVFQAIVGPQTTAVRVFTAGGVNGSARYRALAQHLAQCPVPSFARAAWMDDAIIVDSVSYPIVMMEWIDGQPLSRAIEQRISEPDRLVRLAEVWRTRVRELGEAHIAHGDLQHGNVLVDANDRLRFIDFDGVWVPGAKDTTPTEFGHPNYQHPDRTSPSIWGEHIDWFAALSVFVAIRAVAADRTLWDLHHGDNLIFDSTDYRGPTEVWSRLARSRDHEVRELSSLLSACCEADPLAATSLDQVLRDNQAPTGAAQPADTRPPTAETSDAGPTQRDRTARADVKADWGAEGATADRQPSRDSAADPGRAWFAANPPSAPSSNPPRANPAKGASSAPKARPKSSTRGRARQPSATPKRPPDPDPTRQTPGSSGPIPRVSSRKRKPRYTRRNPKT